MDKKLMTVREAAEALGLSINTIRMMLRRGTLPTVRFDGKMHPRIPADAVFTMLEKYNVRSTSTAEVEQ